MALVLGFGLGLAWTAPARAFWPFTTRPPLALPDSTVERRVEQRFERWQQGLPSTEEPPHTSASVSSRLDSLRQHWKNAGTAGGVQPGQTQTYGAGPSATSPPEQTPQNSSQQPSSQTPAGPDLNAASSAIAAADSARAAADSMLAGADGAPPDSTSDAGAPNGNSPWPGSDPNTPADPAANALAKLAADRAAIEAGFAPAFTSKLGQSNDGMTMNTTMDTRFTDPTGVSLGSTLTYGADLNFNQNTDQRNTGFLNDLRLPIKRIGMDFALSTSNTRTNQEGSVTFSSTATRNTTDTRSGQASLLLSRRLDQIEALRRYARGVGLNASYSRRIGARSNTTIALNGPGSGGTRHSDKGDSYGVGMTFDGLEWMKLKGRLGTAKRTNQDRLTVTQTEDIESKSQGDTATVDVEMPKWWKFSKLVLSLNLSNGDDTTPTPARTASGSQSGQVGQFVLEKHTSERNGVSLTTRFVPAPRLDVGISVNASKNSDDYVERQDQINKTDNYGWRLDSKMTIWKGMLLSGNYEWKLTDLDQDRPNRPSTSTRKDYSNKAYLELSKNLTRTMNVKTYVDLQLDSAHYENEGPQGLGDRDELRQKVGVDIGGAMFDSCLANITAYVRTFDQAFIDPRRSAQSRNETEYVVRPNYTWKITDRTHLRQAFGLSSKVVEDVFEPTRNTLNRSHFMNIGMDHALTSRAFLDTSYDYILQDNGGYLNGGFDPVVRTKKDGIRVGMRYSVIGGDKLVFTSRQESTRIHNFRFRNGQKQPNGITTQGNLALGFESKLDVRGLKLDCHVQRNRSFNSALNRDVFWNVDATVNYTF